MTDPFIYDSLRRENLEIRLLTIIANDLVTADVDIVIETAPLNEFESKYSTLSYTWGAPFENLPPEWADHNVVVPITLNGKHKAVQWNLDAALRALRARKNHGPIWIDALCINQSDMVEKSWQVKMMGDIYKRSKTTIAWLGPDSSDSAEAMSILGSTDPIHPWTIDLSLFFRIATYNSGMEKHLKPETLEGVRAIVNLTNRAWFRRAWVVQEIALSKQLVLTCGSYSDLEVDWEGIRRRFASLRGFTMVVRNKRDTLRSKNQHELIQLAKDVEETERWFSNADKLRVWLDGTRFLTLDNLLWTTSAFHATDLRDKCYAVFGMLEEVVFEPDYHLTVPEVFLGTTKALLNKSKRVDILSLCQPDQLSGLPSWVPNYSMISWTTIATLYSIAGHRNYSAGGESQSNLWFEDQSTLVCSGVILSEISFLGSIQDRNEALHKFESADPADSEKIPQDPQERAAWIHVKHLESTWLEQWRDTQHKKQTKSTWLKQWRNTRRKKQTNYRWTLEPEDQAFVRTLCVDTQPPVIVGTRTRLTHGDYKSALNDDLYASEMAIAFTWSVPLEILPHRVFAATKAGHWCLVREDARIGDVVVVINGAEVPMLLRPNGNGYRFVGECYVHGFMDGEAYAPDKKLKVMEFKIN
jgi:hypothetical protein